MIYWKNKSEVHSNLLNWISEPLLPNLIVYLFIRSDHDLNQRMADLAKAHLFKGVDKSYKNAFDLKFLRQSFYSEMGKYYF